MMTWLLLWSAAWAGELRRVTVEPGITLDVEILRSEEGGFRVSIPQGERKIRLADVLDLVPIEPGERVVTPFEVILVADSRLTPVARAAWADIPELVVRDVAEVVSPEAREACDDDPVCLASAFPQPAWRWIVRVDVVDDALRLSSVLPGRESVARVSALADAPVTLRAAAQQAIELEPDGRVPSALYEAWDTWATRRRAPPPGYAKQVGLGFLPIPGLPSMVRRDGTGTAGAIGTMLLGTAAWVGVTGTTTTSRAEHAALGAAGAYVFTVAANQIFLHADVRRDRADAARPSVGVVPLRTPEAPDAPIGVALNLAWTRW